MRILHTADWHIGKTLYDYSLLEDQEYWAKGLFSLMKEEKIQLLLISGDLYDRAVPSASAVSLLDWIFCTITQEMGIPICAISGNHDSPERLQFGSRLLARQGLYLKTNYQKEWEQETFSDEWGPLNLWFLPYTDHLSLQKDFPDRSIHSAEDAYAVWSCFNHPRISSNERNIVLAHGFFADFAPEQKPQERAVQQKETLFTEAETLVGTIDLASCRHFDCFDYAALGHIHHAQTLGNGTARYAGSPLKYSIAESRQEKSVTLLEIRKKGEIRVEARQIPTLRNLREITGPFENLCAVAAECTQEREDYVAIRLTDQERVVNPMRCLREVFPHILEMRFVEQQGAPSVSSLSSPSLQPIERLKEFYHQVSGGVKLTPSQLALAQKVFREAELEEVAPLCGLSD